MVDAKRAMAVEAGSVGALSELSEKGVGISRLGFDDLHNVPPE
jgi:hypothetical protein